MNTQTAARPHFSVAIEWKSRTIEQWLEQYASWLLIDDRYESTRAKSVLGSLQDKANGVRADGRRRAPPRCNITDDQAFTIEALLSHLRQTETKKTKQWLDVVIAYHVQMLTEEAVADKLNISRFAMKRDKMLGIVRIVSRHSYLHSFLTE